MQINKDAFFRDHFRWRARQGTDILDQYMKRAKAVQGVESVVIQFVSPFSACLRMPVVMTCILAVGIYLAVDSIQIAIQFSSYGSASFKSYRVHVSPPSFDNVSYSISLLHLGCKVFSSPLLSFGNLTALIYDGAEPLEVDGFEYASTDNIVVGTRGHIKLEGRNGDWDGWVPVGSSSFRRVSTGLRLLDEAVPIQRTMLFDFRYPWPLFADAVVGGLTFAMGCVVVGCCGLTHFIFGRDCTNLAKKFFIFLCVLKAMSSFVSACGYTQLGLLREGFLPYCETMAYLLLGIVVVMLETEFFVFLYLIGICLMIFRVTQDCSLYGDCAYMLSRWPWIPTVFICCAWVFLGMRRYFLWKTVLFVRGDRAHYESAWRQAMADNILSCTGFDNVRQAAEGLQSKACIQSVRQLHRVRRDAEQQLDDTDITRRGGVQWSLLWPSPSIDAFVSENRNSSEFDYKKYVPCSADTSSPVQRLDQLYSQALGVASSLEAKCCEWAAACGGSLAMPAAPVWSDQLFGNKESNSALWCRFQQGYIKSPHRAVEKALSCYGGDVSRLLDVCRARIAFDTLDELAECMRLISSQSREVMVVRVKNSLHKNNTRWMNAGFRGAVLNLCIRNDETIDLGVENHVCEVQLVLRFMSFVQSCPEDAQRHSRFLKFRSIRAFSFQERTFWMLFHRSVLPDDFPTQRCVDGGSNYCPPAQEKADQVLKPGTLENETWSHTAPDSSHMSHVSRNGDQLPRTAAVKPFQESDGGSDRVQPLGQGHDDDVTSKVKESFVRMCLWPSNVLDHRESKVELALHHSSMGSAWFTSTPLSSAATFGIFRVLFFVVGCFFLYSGLGSPTFKSSNGQFSLSMARIEVISVRDTQVDPASVSLASWGLLNDGCPLDVSPRAVQRNSTLELSFPSGVEANGYYFITSSASPSHDPTKWTLSVSNDNRSWQVVGASVWRWNLVWRWDLENNKELYPGHEFDTPMSRLRRVDVDMSLSWPVRVESFTGGLEWALCFWAAVPLALTGREYLIKGVFVLGTLIDIVFLITASAGFAVLGNIRETWLSLAFLVPQFSLCISFAFFEHRIVLLLFVYFFLFLFANLLQGFVYFDGNAGATIFRAFMTPPSAVLLLSLTLLHFRRVTVQKARRLVLADMAKYDALWDSLLQADGNNQAVEDLKHQVEQTSASLQRSQPRQCKRLTSPLSTEGIVGKTAEGSTHFVHSLDQLFWQASCMQLVLLEKVKGWALGSGGCFHIQGGTGYTKYSDVASKGDTQVKFARVKSVARAVEKVVRSYRQDASLLVDICRQSIVFQDIGGITQCLALLRSDPDVVILRVKNRLDPGYNATKSSGYRDIAMNLRIVNPETTGLEIDLHVCELQLLLLPFAELKSDEGHKRYVTFRNLRGE